MSKDILVTGASGYVMSSVLRTSEFQCLDLETPTHKELDFTDLEQARKYVRGKRFVIHAGANANVFEARTNYETTKETNGIGAKNIAIACEEFDARMFFVSTDYILPGNEQYPGPYAENSRRLGSFTSVQIGSYASTKLLGELMAEKYCSRLSIVRISYPFGNYGEKDYIRKLIKNAKLGKPIFCDQVVTPTYLPDIAIALNEIVSKDKNGIFHVACKGFASPYVIVNYVNDKLGLKLDICAGSCSEYLKNLNVEPIPQYGGLYTSKTREDLGIELHDWRSAIDEMIENHAIS